MSIRLKNFGQIIKVEARLPLKDNVINTWSRDFICFSYHLCKIAFSPTTFTTRLLIKILDVNNKKLVRCMSIGEIA